MSSANTAAATATARPAWRMNSPPYRWRNRSTERAVKSLCAGLPDSLSNVIQDSVNIVTHRRLTRMTRSGLDYAVAAPIHAVNLPVVPVPIAPVPAPIVIDLSGIDSDSDTEEVIDSDSDTEEVVDSDSDTEEVVDLSPDSAVWGREGYPIPPLFPFFGSYRGDSELATFLAQRRGLYPSGGWDQGFYVRCIYSNIGELPLQINGVVNYPGTFGYAQRFQNARIYMRVYEVQYLLRVWSSGLFRPCHLKPEVLRMMTTLTPSIAGDWSTKLGLMRLKVHMLGREGFRTANNLLDHPEMIRNAMNFLTHLMLMVDFAQRVKTPPTFQPAWYPPARYAILLNEVFANPRLEDLDYPA